jgi:uncharacterized membrane protein YhaH (DUF805 family)
MKGFGFSGRMASVPYGYFTVLFVAFLYVLASSESGSAVKLVLTAPWTVLGQALDRWIRIGGPGASMADTLVSVVVGGAVMWVFAMANVRRLRDIGQSPWWTVLLILSGQVVWVMIVLSLIPSKPSGEGAANGSEPLPALPIGSKS